MLRQISKVQERKAGLSCAEENEQAIFDKGIICHGLLEKVYEICFCHELEKRGLTNRRQLDIPIVYDGLTFDEGLKRDVLVENQVICELKAIENVNPVWKAQVLSHLKILNKRLGYLINFNVVKIANGIDRLVL